MNARTPFEIAGRLRSVRYALRGILCMLRTQPNAWIHCVATVLVITAGFAAGLSPGEWCWIILAISTVWTAEALNTALEFLADATTREFHPLICSAKDVAAGAVLLTAIASAAIGIIIFVPHLAA